TVRGYLLQQVVRRADLTWSGLIGANVDVYRDGTRITTTPNDGAMTDAINSRGSASYTYKVCAAGTSTCSNEVRITF
ncbi:MAG: alkaline serine protease, partial [Acidobacteria bacterium]|nr:alkaline serine protease [Acidobacteriota bacterium]